MHIRSKLKDLCVWESVRKKSFLYWGCFWQNWENILETCFLNGTVSQDGVVCFTFLWIHMHESREGQPRSTGRLLYVFCLLPQKTRECGKDQTEFLSREHWLSICEAFIFCKTTGVLDLHALCLLANVLRLIFPLPPRKQNESCTITKDGEKRGIGGIINIYLCGSVWFCQLIFKCLNDLCGSPGCHICPLSPWIIYGLTFMDLSIWHIHGRVLLSFMAFMSKWLAKLGH